MCKGTGRPHEGRRPCEIVGRPCGDGGRDWKDAATNRSVGL
jgi:hypothetical protein